MAWDPSMGGAPAYYEDDPYDAAAPDPIPVPAPTDGAGGAPPGWDPVTNPDTPTPADVRRAFDVPPESDISKMHIWGRGVADERPAPRPQPIRRGMLPPKPVAGDDIARDPNTFGGQLYEHDDEVADHYNKQKELLDAALFGEHPEGKVLTPDEHAIAVERLSQKKQKYHDSAAQFDETLPGLQEQGARNQMRGYESHARGAMQSHGIRESGYADQQGVVEDLRGRLDRVAERREQNKRAFDQKWARENSEFKAAQNELQTARIDPNRMWGSTSGLGKAATILAAAVSGYLSSKTGQKNVALEMLQKSIDRDIDAQKATLNSKHRAISGKQSQLGMLRQKLGDDQAANDALRDHHLRSAQQQLQGLSAGAASEQERNNIRVLQEDIQIAREGAGLARKTRAETRHQQELFARRQAAAAAAARVQQGQWLRKQPKNAQQTYVRLPDGRQGLAPDSKTADRLRQKAASVGRINVIVGQLMHINSKGAESITPTDRTTAASLGSSLKLEAAVAANLGAISKDDERLVIDQIGPDPTGLFTLDSQAAAGLTTMKQTSNMGLSREYEAANMIPVERGFTPEGPQYRYTTPSSAEAPGNVQFKPKGQ